MKSKQLHFFSTSEDLKNTLSKIEEKEKIKYMQSGLFDNPDQTCYQTYSEIPKLGISDKGTFNGQIKYLITTANNEFNIDAVPQRRGGTKYNISSYNNSSSISFTPSGEYNNYCLIRGNISGVNNENEISLYLYELFFKQFKKGFRVIRSFRVSTQAEALLDKGFKLTSNYKSMPEMDLSKPEVDVSK